MAPPSPLCRPAWHTWGQWPGPQLPDPRGLLGMSPESLHGAGSRSQSRSLVPGGVVHTAPHSTLACWGGACALPSKRHKWALVTHLASTRPCDWPVFRPAVLDGVWLHALPEAGLPCLPAWPCRLHPCPQTTCPALGQGPGHCLMGTLIVSPLSSPGWESSNFGSWLSLH